MDTLAFKRTAHLSGKEGEQQFNQAVDTLQMDIRSYRSVYPMSVVGDIHSSMILSLASFQISLKEPGSFQIGMREINLILNYLTSVGAASENDIRKLFKWELDITRSVMDELIASQQVKHIMIIDKDLTIPGYVIPDLI